MARADDPRLAARDAVNARRVPAALQDDLLGRINELVARPAPCPGSSARGAARQAQAVAAWLRESSESY